MLIGFEKQPARFGLIVGMGGIEPTIAFGFGRGLARQVIPLSAQVRATAIGAGFPDNGGDGVGEVPIILPGGFNCFAGQHLFGYLQTNDHHPRNTVAFVMRLIGKINVNRF